MFRILISKLNFFSKRFQTDFYGSLNQNTEFNYKPQKEKKQPFSFLVVMNLKKIYKSLKKYLGHFLMDSPTFLAIHKWFIYLFVYYTCQDFFEYLQDDIKIGIK